MTKTGDHQRSRCSRRRFVQTSGCLLYGCSLVACESGTHSHTGQRPLRRISVGALEGIPQGLSVRPLERLVLNRQGETLRVFSQVCSHQHCLLVLRAQDLVCPCHGARFSADGLPLVGPATEPLAQFAVEIDTNGVVWVDLSTAPR